MPDIVDDSGEMFTNDGIFSKVTPHDITEEIASHKDGRVLIERLSYASGQHGKVAHVDHRRTHLHGSWRITCNGAEENRLLCTQSTVAVSGVDHRRVRPTMVLQRKNSVQRSL